MLTITVPTDLATRLTTEASRRGLEPSEFATRLLDAALSARAGGGGSGDASLAILARWEAENRTDDPAEIAHRHDEFRAFKDAMNQSRLEMEGPDSRKPFP